MAEQIFPLSPIAARAAQPSDEDYDAIREAFMETARGRWFLNQYAKRNRNADTTLVLDAVARLESSIAAQKQEPQQEDRSAHVIAAVTSIIGQGRNEAEALLAQPDQPSDDSPALKGVQVLREMAWALRESGSDGRIPDILQRQASAIEDGLKASAAQDIRDQLLAVFERLDRAVTALAENKPAPSEHHDEPQAATEATPPVENVDELPADDLPEDDTPLAALDETLALISDEFALAEPDPEPEPPAQPALHVVAEAPVPDEIPSPPSAVVAAPESPAPAPIPLSLGAALLETGIVSKPDAGRSDPLAPFRRMTQAERIAFFS